MTSAATPGSQDAVEITDAPAASRYELRVEGQLVGLATYHDRDGVRGIPHTEVDPALGGRGLASRLVAFALEDIRARGLLVDPQCPFVADYLHKHPQYADLQPSGTHH